MTTINSDEINRRVQAIATKIDKTQRKATFKPALTKTGAHLVDKMGEAPRRGDAFSRYATPVQRRAYWARVGDDPSIATADGAYKRTGSAKRWTFDVKSGERVEVGNNAPHGVYLWGDRRPKWVKEQGWPGAEEVLEDEADVIVGFFEDALEKALRDDT